MHKTDTRGTARRRGARKSAKPKPLPAAAPAARAAEDPTARLSRLGPGDIAVFREPTVVVAVLRGPEVAIALYDGEAGVGGVNHFVAATPAGSELACERLLARVLAAGAQASRVCARLVAGAGGESSVAAARRWLDGYGIEVAGVDAGGRVPRSAFFELPGGEARVSEGDGRESWSL